MEKRRIEKCLPRCTTAYSSLFDLNTEALDPSGAHILQTLPGGGQQHSYETGYETSTHLVTVISGNTTPCVMTGVTLHSHFHCREIYLQVIPTPSTLNSHS